jgi:ATP-dependent DNA helicase RecQ
LILVRPIRSPGRSIDDASSLAAGNLPCDLGLFQKLRVLRKQVADGRGVPPYLIFGDASLRQMASYFPQTEESFLRISEVGRVKLDEFSEPFLALISDYAAANGLVGREAPKGRRERNGAVRRGVATQEETKRLARQKLPVSDIAETRGLSVRTIVNHLEQSVIAGEVFELDYLMPPPERLAKIERAFQESGGLLLAPVRELLGEDYSYLEINLARIGLRQKASAAAAGPTQAATS